MMMMIATTFCNIFKVADNYTKYDASGFRSYDGLSLARNGFS